MEFQGMYLIKAKESLFIAEYAFDNKKYNSSANRSYYACFQAAIHALISEGIKNKSKRKNWEHEFVQSEFNGKLINSKKLFSSSLGSILSDTEQIRSIADYSDVSVSERKAEYSLNSARLFVAEVRNYYSKI